MNLDRMILRNFRNYREAEVAFAPGINLILGSNGQGKTNLLEAIHVVSTGRSFRTHRLSDLILQGERFFFIEAYFHKGAIAQSIKIYYDETTRRVQYNQTSFPHLANLLGILPSVFLSPDDLLLVSGSPADRRRFLDLNIAQIDPLYVHHLSRYFRAMKQRNHVLRSPEESVLSAFEETMAQSATYLIHKRQEMTRLLEEPTAEWLSRLSGARDQLSLIYSSSLHQSDYRKQWERMRPKEIQHKATLVGPHRDDLEILLSGKRARQFSSEGQKRSSITALRLAEWRRMHELIGHPPLLAIDDFGIQLDALRQSALKHHLGEFGQVFLTSPLPIEELSQGYALHVQEGQVRGTL